MRRGALACGPCQPVATLDARAGPGPVRRVSRIARNSKAQGRRPLARNCRLWKQPPNRVVARRVERRERGGATVPMSDSEKIPPQDFLTFTRLHFEHASRNCTGTEDSRKTSRPASAADRPSTRRETQTVRVLSATISARPAASACAYFRTTSSHADGRLRTHVALVNEGIAEESSIHLRCHQTPP